MATGNENRSRGQVTATCYKFCADFAMGLSLVPSIGLTYIPHITSWFWSESKILHEQRYGIYFSTKHMLLFCMDMTISVLTCLEPMQSENSRSEMSHHALKKSAMDFFFLPATMAFFTGIRKQSMVQFCFYDSINIVLFQFVTSVININMNDVPHCNGLSKNWSTRHI